MKPKKDPRPVPSGIFKRAAAEPKQLALFIFLDDVPFCELAARNEKDFRQDLRTWSKTILPTLAKSNVRYFARSADGAITEVAF